jgi:Zn finger protein HypA/HybF involved in hydrogenase expression
MVYNIEEDEDVVETEEELVGDPLEVTHRCTACYDEFTLAELKGDTNNCPSCNETDVIIER